MDLISTKSMHIIFFFVFILFLISNIYSTPSIALNKGEVKVSNSNIFDNFSKTTWNLWLNQNTYNSNAGIIGKYEALAGKRSFLIRTVLDNSISIILSQDGITTNNNTSLSKLKCGIRNNNEWTMLSIVYDGSNIKYYRNGILCDTDSTNVTEINNSISDLRLGAGNNIFFSGLIDEHNIYNNNLKNTQILRLYNESSYGSNLGQSIPVLVYHKIDSSNNTIAVTEANFKEQIKYLHDNDFKTVTLRDYYNWINGNFAMPKKAIILVFDDGFYTVYSVAKPIMDQYGFVGSLASVTRYASFNNPGTGYMSWVQVKSLHNSGWSIESHGVNHAHSLTLNEKDFRYELSESKKILTNEIGEIPKSFVFPFHEANINYTAICGEYYELCWTQGSTNESYDYISTNGKEYLGLRRINLTNLSTLQSFKDFLGRDTDIINELLMNEGLGNTTEDTSGNNNNGILSNGASWDNDGTTTLITTNSTNKTATKTKIKLINKNKKPLGLNVSDNMSIEKDEYYPK